VSLTRAGTAILEQLTPIARSTYTRAAHGSYLTHVHLQVTRTQRVTSIVPVILDVIRVIDARKHGYCNVVDANNAKHVYARSAWK